MNLFYKTKISLKKNLIEQPTAVSFQNIDIEYLLQSLN